MKLIRGYYAFLAIAGGVLLRLAAAENWMLQIVAFALISAGALSLQRVSRWFLRASVTADVLIGFEVVLGPQVLPPGFYRIVLTELELVPLLLLGCMLFLAFADQMRAAGKPAAAEWVLLAVWSAGLILSLLTLLLGGWLTEPVSEAGFKIARLLLPIGHIALIADSFRAQKEYIRTEGNE
ncbi:MAG: hypothetical protein Q4C72_05180 [Eubacteriales bacterium]|nr:hypothetical protein [Eubacteriales bacterium]